ncbi:hypothetical protein HCN56_25640, partial [Streptomyces lonarensis]|nr:hypothetical protein [Streptomyces lonarensis]
TRPGERGATLRGRVTEATEAAVATLGFRPALVTEGPVDSETPCRVPTAGVPGR